MSVHRIAIIAFAALPLVTTNASAQDAWRYRGWDRNNDGVITRSEWRGAQQLFRELDRNDDGVLTATELRGDRQVADARWDANTFANLDFNNDGRIARSEWLGDRETFRQVDRNGDLFITRGEFMNANVDYGDYDITDLSAMDYDRNGRIEEDEWRGTTQAFRRLDINRDGVLSRSELSTTDAIVAGDDFAALDYDNNEVISRSEWSSRYGTFSRYDTNRDGVITRREYSTSSSGRGIERHTIQVDSRTPWVNTGIYVNAGDIISYDAAGNIQMSTNPDDRATPAGSVTGRNANNSPRPDQRAGGLLARVGGSSVAFLGANGSFTAQNSGELMLGVNDDHFPDNTGEFRVSLTVQAR